MGTDNLEGLDQCFVEIYEAARAKMLKRQEHKALIVVDDDVLLLYRGNYPVETFAGLRPPLYVKMKTLGHMPLAAYCLLHDETDAPLSATTRQQIANYRAAIDQGMSDLDTSAEVAKGLLPAPSSICAKVSAVLDHALANDRISKEALSAFARDVEHDIEHVLAAAARVQLDVCDTYMKEIRKSRLTQEQWDELHVLILGPYMARQGQNFLQYFSKLLDTPMEGDKRIVYFDGEDLDAAYARLGTAMLDAEASAAIFGNTERLHRDVLADATKKFLSETSGDTPA